MINKLLTVTGFISILIITFLAGFLLGVFVTASAYENYLHNQKIIEDSANVMYNR
jgi:uncharacterized protein YneF (UPF0154 family)